MKKFLSIILLAFFALSNFSFAQIDTTPQTNGTQIQGTNPSPIDYNLGGGSSSSNPNTSTTTTTTPTATTEISCQSPLQTDATSNYTTCCIPSSSKDECLNYQTGDTNCIYGGDNNTYKFCVAATATTSASTASTASSQSIMGMTINPTCLLNGQCKFNIYDALGIRTSVRKQGDPTSVGIFAQDIVLSATMFIGTVVTIAIIVSGLMRIFAGASGKDPTKAKFGLINALIGLLLVVSSYLIIRLVQYVAKGV